MCIRDSKYSLCYLHCLQPRGRGTPGRTWEVVDASYYGGRGAGGIRPMTVSVHYVTVLLLGGDQPSF